jgi:hypothetical protein
LFGLAEKVSHTNDRGQSRDAQVGQQTESHQVIEATGLLGGIFAWLSGNYQRALFHKV